MTLFVTKLNFIACECDPNNNTESFSNKAALVDALSLPSKRFTMFSVFLSSKNEPVWQAT